MTDLIDYFIRISPGVVFLVACYFLLPKTQIFPKLVLFIFGFLLIRDAMTPLGFWRIGLADDFMVWFRFIDDGALLITLGIISLLITLLIVYSNPLLNQYLYWISDKRTASIVVGIAGAALVSAPFLLMYNTIPIEQRGEAVATTLLLPLFILTIFGNFMEEVLFRGYLQGYFETITSPWRAVLLSGLFFSIGHIFLAITVTDIGMMILIFTLYEGLICACVRLKHGIIAATLTHGLAIFILASGIV
ncbi:MAG: CPBP family intramembrane metalloprotease [Alkalibacterium sp.]|nr:CPBP family intramembrane metalloprotease [Alkalibacterium sp.]